jgi:hypothetical protein
MYLDHLGSIMAACRTSNGLSSRVAGELLIFIW